MAEYKSDVATINYDINLVYSKLSHPSKLQNLLSELPADIVKTLENISFEDDCIVINANPVGEVKLRLKEKEEPTKIVFSGEGTVVPIKIVMNFEDAGAGTTKGFAVIDIDIPVFVKPMVDKPLKEGCKKLGDLLAMIPYDKI